MLLAVVIALAWVALRMWPRGDDSAPVSMPSIVPSTTPSVEGTAPAEVPPSTAPTPPPEQTTTSVTLSGGGKPCKSTKVRMSAHVDPGQLAQQPVNVDLAISTTGRRACVFTPRSFDPLAVVSRDGKRLWDSSVCKSPVATAPAELVPGWSTVVRVGWMPRKSGQACAGTEAWLPPGTYTLDVGTLGGEPGRTTFELLAPPPPVPPVVDPGVTPPASAAPAPADQQADDETPAAEHMD